MRNRDDFGALRCEETAVPVAVTLVDREAGPREQVVDMLGGHEPQRAATDPRLGPRVAVEVFGEGDVLAVDGLDLVPHPDGRAVVVDDLGHHVRSPSLPGANEGIARLECEA